MPVKEEVDSLDDILRKANRILEDCSCYVSERMEEEEIENLTGIEQVEKIFDYQADFFTVHHAEYVRLKGYEDRLFFETDKEEFYHKHLVCLQNCRKALIEAIQNGIEDRTIRKGLEPKQEAAVLEGAFGSVLRSECEKLKGEEQEHSRKMKKLLKECVRMSMVYLRNE